MTEIDTVPAGSARPANVQAVMRRKSNARTDSPFWAFLFVGPNLILFTVFIVLPIIAAFALSLYDWNLISEPRFVGIRNYTDILNDARALNSVVKTVYLVVLGVVPTVVLSFFLAVLINTTFPGYSVFRTMYLLPIVISFVASAVLWRFIYDPRVGPIAELLSAFGVTGPNWLKDTTWALPALSVVIVWLRLPLGIILYLAALQQINPQLMEAAEIDGAGPWAKLRHIIWPNVMPVTLLILVINLRGIIFDSFDVVQVMTGGGPLNSTDILIRYIYDMAFAQLRLGYASALSTVLFVIVAILALIFNPPRRKPINGDPV
ncbi:sugar ABC transporter permease [Devosia sp.]|uniref:carbohydrate ABC transporter permease n=1 Tax=Devosia sp. TaxID=1871048 RepID=UPI002608953B|nr:sugar ABC transporter permease [Devosia sp.]